MRHRRSTPHEPSGSQPRPRGTGRNPATYPRGTRPTAPDATPAVNSGEAEREAEQAPRRRGRRPGGADTRAALVDAARAIFTEQGYDGATVRAIAARAQVDAAMVNHWFGGKDGLFAEAVLKLPFNPQDVVERLLDGEPEDLGERIVRTFITVWDTSGGGVFTALVRSVASHDQAAHALRDFLVKHIVHRVLSTAAPDDVDFRATLVASQLIGMGMVRYVAHFEPLASADVDTMVAAVAPTLQRYISGTVR